MPFLISRGVSMYLKNAAYDNNLDTSWASSFSTFGGWRHGTPGHAWDDTSTIAVISDNFQPEEIKFYPSYPNPFNPIKTISFGISNTAFIKVNIYDVNGRLVDNL
ncbi:MAG: hypothetical protein CM1200mP10_21250 [Candidatus Neomarinimicrobiota bacterium]|nr:MAG: hypothetical protein CM1200mP10_21250 [Candidatus Neomarinimicrobiota bacterium]